MARRLAREEGLLAGGSCGTAVAAALKYAARLSQPKRIVVLLPDTGRNYINKIYSDPWMQENGFWEGNTIKATKLTEILARKVDFPSLVSVSPRDTLRMAIALLQKLNISQLPVIDDKQVVGSLTEALLMKLLHEGINFSNQEVSAVMGKPLPVLDREVDVAEAYRVLLSGTTGIIVKSDEVPVGLITRADLIRYWISQTEESQNGI